MKAGVGLAAIGAGTGPWFKVECETSIFQNFSEIVFFFQSFIECCGNFVDNSPQH